MEDDEDDEVYITLWSIVRVDYKGNEIKTIQIFDELCWRVSIIPSIVFQ